MFGWYVGWFYLLSIFGMCVLVGLSFGVILVLFGWYGVIWVVVGVIVPLLLFHYFDGMVLSWCYFCVI